MDTPISQHYYRHYQGYKGEPEHKTSVSLFLTQALLSCFYVQYMRRELLLQMGAMDTLMYIFLYICVYVYVSVWVSVCICVCVCVRVCIGVDSLSLFSI